MQLVESRNETFELVSVSKPMPKKQARVRKFMESKSYIHVYLVSRFTDSSRSNHFGLLLYSVSVVLFICLQQQQPKIIPKTSDLPTADVKVVETNSACFHVAFGRDFEFKARVFVSEILELHPSFRDSCFKFHCHHRFFL